MLPNCFSASTRGCQQSGSQGYQYFNIGDITSTNNSSYGVRVWHAGSQLAVALGFMCGILYTIPALRHGIHRVYIFNCMYMYYKICWEVMQLLPVCNCKFMFPFCLPGVPLLRDIVRRSPLSLSSCSRLCG